jgi:hypothetical protein
MENQGRNIGFPGVTLEKFIETQKKKAQRN